MKRVARFLVRLYPATWRARYGEEFETLIEDSSPGWRATLDLLKGAIRMQLSVSSFARLAVALSLTGGVCGLALSIVVPHYYVSTAEMQLSAVGPEASERVIQIEKEVLSPQNVSMIVQHLDLYNKQRADIERMRQRDSRISVGPAADDHVNFRISFIYPNRMKALQTMQALVRDFAGAGPEVIEAPSAPAEPVYPDRVVFLVFGCVTGFALAMVTAMFRREPPTILFPAQAA